nr:ATP-dependent 6-phosphofructokinase 4, chloroplastic-like [Tanacetum cinerariifolium]
MGLDRKLPKPRQRKDYEDKTEFKVKASEMSFYLQLEHRDTFVNPEDVLAQQGGYKGFYSRNTMELTPKNVNDIHKRGGTILQTSRGGHDTNKIVDNIQDRGINQRCLRVAVAGIPKTIDNDIAVIDKSFGFDTAVEEAQRAINAAHVEVESVENGVGIVKLMGRYSGFIAMFATLASRDVGSTP